MATTKITPTFTWNSKKTSADLDTALKTLSVRYPALDAKSGTTELIFSKTGKDAECGVSILKDGYKITYKKLNMALRMVGNLLSGIVPEKADYCPYEMFGIMLDCSRNSVKTVEFMKSYLDRLAIFGYNMVMLYTEETYKIDSEPFFGLMRGAYSGKEIKEIDDYAAKLGIELIPCIQTLAHLEQMFRWPKFNDINDLGGILLVDEPKTYKLIEKMLVTWKKNVRSRKIHLGMDEAHGLGTGKFKQLHGEQRSFDIINRHLNKVVALCKKHGLEPMMWSDMFFRLGSKTGDYYDQEWKLPPKDVVDGIPPEVSLVYWDYYHDDQKFYTQWIKHHRALSKNEPLIGSGVWTWNKFWYDQLYTESTVTPCMNACRETKLKNVFFTMWGDDGGFCDYNSAFGGLAFASELSFTGKADKKLIEKKFNKLLNGSSYADNLALASVSCYELPRFLWDDPVMLMAIGSFMVEKNPRQAYAKKFDFQLVLKDLQAAAAKLAKAKDAVDGGTISYARAFAAAVAAKLTYADAYLKAYQGKNKRAEVVKVVPLAEDYLNKLDAFCIEMRKMWFAQNKPFGFEGVQIRLAGQLARAGEAVIRLQEFADGKVASIPETDELLKVCKDLQLQWGSWGRVSHGTGII